MSEVAVSNNLPASLNKMASALRQSATQTSGGGDAYLRCSKGEWIYGADSTEVEETSTWAVNPLSFEHGFVAWGSRERGNSGVNVGEILVSASDPLPQESNLPDVNGDWSRAISIQLKCASGEDIGQQVVFKANSVGAKNAYASLLGAVVDKIELGDPACVPVVTLKTDNYRHSTYGKIYVPVFEIQSWQSLDGAATPAPVTESIPAPAAAETEAETPTRRRRAQ